MKISLILTILSFAAIIYLMVVRFILEEPTNLYLLFGALGLAIISSILRRKGK